MKKLPIGIQTFHEIIEGNYYYVDKTEFAYKLITKGKYYFLSRPRRFGKSLFLDTLAEIFLGNRELFKGLYIYDRYDFTPHPVIRISFGSGDYSLDEDKTIKEIKRILKRTQRENNVECEDIGDYKSCFEELELYPNLWTIIYHFLIHAATLRPLYTPIGSSISKSLMYPCFIIIARPFLSYVYTVHHSI